MDSREPSNPAESAANPASAGTAGAGTSPANDLANRLRAAAGAPKPDAAKAPESADDASVETAEPVAVEPGRAIMTILPPLRDEPVVDVPQRRFHFSHDLATRAAVIALAAAFGAVFGSLVTMAFTHPTTTVVSSDTDKTLGALAVMTDQLARDFHAFKAETESGTALPPRSEDAAAGNAVSSETTGSIATAKPADTGWVVWRVHDGRAVVQGNGGTFDITAGSDLPGLGKVHEIVRQDGRWAVVTDGGTILPPVR